jgi:hypothetical protein
MPCVSQTHIHFVRLDRESSFPRMTTAGDVGIKGQVGPPPQMSKFRRSHARQECEKISLDRGSSILLTTSIRLLWRRRVPAVPDHRGSSALGICTSGGA